MSTADLRSQLQSLAEARFLYLFGVADLDVVRAAEPDALALVEKMGTVPLSGPSPFSQRAGDAGTTRETGTVPASGQSLFSRALVFGFPLQDAVLESLVDRPTPIYFHLYRQANYQLDSVALEAAALVQHAGFRAIAIAASQIVDRGEGEISRERGEHGAGNGDGPRIGTVPISRPIFRGHVSHRLLGWAAGLGWRGRNNLLVNPTYGSRVRYVSVLTDAPIEPDRPLDRDCGKCVACLRVCPAEAIQGKCEDFRLDLCYAKLCEFARIPFVGQHICGVCVKTCHPSHWPSGSLSP